MQPTLLPAHDFGPPPGWAQFALVDSPDIPEYPLHQVMDKVILGDALQVLPKLPGESVDMVFLDPPYFLQLPRKRLVRWGVRTPVEGVDEAWDKFGSFAEYDAFLTRILQEVRRLMRPTATLWAIGTYHNIFRVGKILQDLGFWILNDVIWVKPNPMPNWLNVRFTNATETLIWAVKDKGCKGYTFHHAAARRYASGRVARNIWEVPLCTGRERVKDASGRTLHPTQKPEALLERVLAVSTRPGDVVLDPLAGVGTTGVVARRMGRQCIMVERERRYVEATLLRLQCINGVDDLVVTR
ncbi:MAG: site-specific DNA-methyltransferase [Dehalococcoidia bacterium]|nr:site-specific DNA-methyltransferase [Dehalococcoidia bacterium]MDW8120439.1 DNA methyltransferase [Chloroflexota bacterium]